MNPTWAKSQVAQPNLILNSPTPAQRSGQTSFGHDGESYHFLSFTLGFPLCIVTSELGFCRIRKWATPTSGTRTPRTMALVHVPGESNLFCHCKFTFHDFSKPIVLISYWSHIFWFSNVLILCNCLIGEYYCFNTIYPRVFIIMLLICAISCVVEEFVIGILYCCSQFSAIVWFWNIIV